MITGRILQGRGWPQGKVIGLAKAVADSLMAREGLDEATVLDRLDAVRTAPAEFVDDPTFGALAREAVRRFAPPPVITAEEALRDQPLDFPTWGQDQIDQQTRAQMEQALRLPVAVAGALMPDAHLGYGLPIGGVLAAHEAVIPFAVGVDIACRMRLSLYPDALDALSGRKDQLRKALLDRTRFGLSGLWDRSDRPDHAVLEDPDWRAMPLLRSLRDKAHNQLGTSGTGNHFVEWGIFTLYQDDAQLGLAAGKYLALLSHSGSRGVGFKSANTYTDIATKLHPHLDASVKHLAWLPIESAAGQEYWTAMELAGRFASANHEVIHRQVAAAAGLKEIARVENHHNYAWRETLPDGTSAIVHRKGATPAGPGVLGVIPGSMGDAGYVVRGKGDPASLNSAAHGAGRKMSRRAAFASVTKTARDAYLRERGVTLLGGALDEAPQAYKNIESVIAAQCDLVEIIGKFIPRIVRMAEEAGDF